MHTGYYYIISLDEWEGRAINIQGQSGCITLNKKERVGAVENFGKQF